MYNLLNEYTYIHATIHTESQKWIIEELFETLKKSPDKLEIQLNGMLFFF